MKLFNTIVNWLILTVLIAIPAGIASYLILALTHSTKMWQGYRIHYFYVTRTVIVLLVLGLIILAGLKLLIIALTVEETEPADDSANDSANDSTDDATDKSQQS